jgi:WD40 repeat protein
MVYDLYTGELHKKYNGHKAVVRDCQWHPYDNEIITSGWDGSILCWRYDARRTTAKHLDADSQVVQPYDSTDEYDEPLPKSIQEREKRTKQRNAQVFNPANTWRGPPNTVMNRAARIKYAQVDPDPPSTDDSDEESYAAAAKRARRRLRRSGAES